MSDELELRRGMSPAEANEALDRFVEQATSLDAIAEAAHSIDLLRALLGLILPNR